MRFVISTDEDLPVVAHVASILERHGHTVVRLPVTSWANASMSAAREVASGGADQAIVFCHTGTGASIAANKVNGIRAALCGDPQTAAGARRWNDANVLALSLRLLTNTTAEEIVGAWLAGEYGATEDESLAAIARAERG